MRAPGNRGRDVGEPRAQTCHEGGCFGEVSGRRTDGEDGLQHVFQGSWIDRQHLSLAPEVSHRLIDVADVNRADSAEILREHELRVDLAESVRVECVDVVACGRPRPSIHRLSSVVNIPPRQRKFQGGAPFERRIAPMPSAVAVASTPGAR